MPRILRLHDFSGPTGLRLDKLPSAQPGPGEARLKVLACSVTIDQLAYLEGKGYGEAGRPALPARFGYGATGVVDAIGENVDPSWLGKSVAPIGPFDQARYGCAGEEAIVPADTLVELPANLSPEQGAALWIPYLTAYALVLLGQVRAGDHVVLPGGSSTVGLAAIQICRAVGALPIAVTRSEQKVAALLAAGAQAVVHTGTQDYVTQLDRLTDGAGARITFDPVGGSFLTAAAAASAPGGIIIEYGVLGGLDGRFPAEQVIGKGLTIRGWTVGELVADPVACRQAIDHVLQRVATGNYLPTVAAVFPLADVVAACHYVQAGTGLGRTVLLPEN